MENEKLYGPIGIANGIGIEVYNNNEKIYEGQVNDAPDEIRNLKYRKVELKNGKCIFSL
ncbi:MAG: hypothetical protein ACI4VO_06235 [Clostridia bacterium]